MLFPREFLESIRDGVVTLAFRRCSGRRFAWSWNVLFPNVVVALGAKILQCKHLYHRSSSGVAFQNNVDRFGIGIKRHFLLS
jgi:energy-converting hydrogenase Eha subunit A